MKKGFIISMSITALQFIAAIILFCFLPEQIPIHWNISGTLDRFGSKAFIFLIPAISLATILLLNWLPKIAPKGENVKRSGKLYPLLMVIVSLIMAVLFVFVTLASLGHTVSTIQIVLGMIGFLMMIIGNYSPKVKQNSVLGIRLPWTLANENVWTKTHRLGGWVFFAIGLLVIVAIFLRFPANFILPFAGLFIGCLAISGYAFHLYKQIS